MNEFMVRRENGEEVEVNLVELLQSCRAASTIEESGGCIRIRFGNPLLLEETTSVEVRPRPVSNDKLPNQSAEIPWPGGRFYGVLGS